MKGRNRLWIKGLLWVLVLSLVLVQATGCDNGKASKNTLAPLDYWPTDGFKTSTPESQGMSSAMITDMFNHIEENNYGIHQVLVIRNGYAVAEASYYPYKAGDLHIVNSVTKSVTSSLIGKAIDEKLIKSTETPVTSFFPDAFKNGTQDPATLQLKHLLTMSAGLEWSEDGNYGADYDSYTQMFRSENPIDYILDQPIAEEPGTTFYYNTGASHLLSGILSKVTGVSALEYAKKSIFDQIGVKQVFWGADKQGVTAGGSRLFMNAQDLAKFGFLYLNKGKWENQQVLSEGWVNESTSKHMETPAGLAGKSGYGYQWWMNPFGGYSGRGYRGQYLFVLPEQNMVVVFFSGLEGRNFFVPETLVADYLLPAIKSDNSMAEDKEASNLLIAKINGLQSQPESQGVGALPDRLKMISGKVHNLPEYEVIRVEFTEGAEEAILHWLVDGDQYDVPVGLDGRYRMSTCDNFIIKGLASQVGFRGNWTENGVFSVAICPVESDTQYLLTLDFQKDELVKTFEAAD